MDEHDEQTSTASDDAIGDAEPSRLARVVGIDDETAHRTFQANLVGRGFAVVATFDSVEAFVESGVDADTVLLDLWIRKPTRPLRGLAAVRALKHLGLRVLIYSMDERAPMLGRLLAAGADGFVSKASTEMELTDALERVCRGDVVLTDQLEGLAEHLRSAGLLNLSSKEEIVLRARARGVSVRVIASSTYSSVAAVERRITSVNEKVRRLLSEVDVAGLTAADASHGGAHIIAKALGYGPGDMLDWDEHELP